MNQSNFLKRKEQLFSSKTAEKELISLGDRFLEAGRLHDAAAFFGRAHHLEGLAEIRRRAIEQGNVMLFRDTLKNMNKAEADSNEWRQLAQHAESKGRWRDAMTAYEVLSDAVGAKRAQKALWSIMGVTDDDGEKTEEGGETPNGRSSSR